MITNGWKNSNYYQGNYYFDNYYLDWGTAIGEILYLSLYSLISQVDYYNSEISTMETYYSIISTEVTA
jgi:hypothetical protein